MPDKDTGKRRNTHEQSRRTLERKDGMAKPGEGAEIEGAGPSGSRTPRDPAAPQSEVQVGRGGVNQESLDRNDPDHSGHRLQKHGLAEEKP